MRINDSVYSHPISDASIPRNMRTLCAIISHTVHGPSTLKTQEKLKLMPPRSHSTSGLEFVALPQSQGPQLPAAGQGENGHCRKFAHGLRGSPCRSQRLRRSAKFRPDGSSLVRSGRRALQESNQATLADFDLTRRGCTVARGRRRVRI
jgi:hypothetical protein